MRELLDSNNSRFLSLTALSPDEVQMVAGGQRVNEVIDRVEGDIKGAGDVLKEAGEVVKETEKAVGYVDQALEGLGLSSKYAKPLALGAVSLFVLGVGGAVVYFRCRGAKSKTA